MKFIQLKKHRINLETVSFYKGRETNSTGYISITFVDSRNFLEIVYDDKKEWELNLKMLDFVCVSNKRGDVKELRRNETL